MIRVDHHRAAAMLLCLATFGCSEPTALELSEDLRLRSIAGQALPAEWSDDIGYRPRMAGGRLLLRPDGTGAWSFSTIYQPPPDITWGGGLRWTESDGRIVVTFVCDRPSLCLDGPHLIGERRYRDVVFTPALSLHMKGPLVYRRR